MKKCWIGCLVIGLLSLAGCAQTTSDTGGPVPVPKGILSGTVRDVADTALAGVTVTLSAGPTVLATALTAADGSYALTASAGTGRTVSYTKVGYLPTTYYAVSLASGITTTLETVLTIPTAATGAATVSGTLTDAFDGTPLAGATVDAFPGINFTSGSPLAKTVTDAGGNYTFTTLTSGNYTARVTKTGYLSVTFTLRVVGGTTRANQNSSATPTILASQIRVVLTWGSTPSDLDSHLRTPDGSHVYFSHKGASGSAPFALLDTDEMSSYGPETITIYTESPGTYTYYVHDYSNKSSTTSTALASSGAVVKVYIGSAPAVTFNVPGGVGTLWKVFTLNGTTVTPVNQMLLESTASFVASRGPGAFEPGEATFFSALPPK